MFFGSVITCNFFCQNTRYSSRFSLNQSRNHVEATKGSHTRINIKSHQVQVCLNLHLMCVFMLPFEISGINWHNLETPWAISPKTQQQPPTAMCTAGVVCMYQRLSGRLLYWIQVWLLSTSSPLASNQGVTELCCLFAIKHHLGENMFGIWPLFPLTKIISPANDMEMRKW